ncbi:MAG: hypothetical protein ABWY37_08820 [Microbacterium pygmaeum]|uniref:Uncharacterized protein n=1 Tax=Microbacterium pygmaeum TaxID=370764 RepID=A0A1G7V3R0_9MICO|nr:hypothetical protein [Microbacterium pygmaeum]SDG54384.1 hypothetical protein SAMN04489810_0585 [Microbacterium pygmaeum]
MTAHVMEVVVRGRLGPDLIAALEGFTVSTDGAGATHVVGSVPDQPALLGLLDVFRDLNIEVVSVNPLDR